MDNVAPPTPKPVGHKWLPLDLTARAWRPDRRAGTIDNYVFSVKTPCVRHSLNESGHRPRPRTQAIFSGADSWSGAGFVQHGALEGYSQSLAREVASFGIDVTLIEPGGYSTAWVGPSAKRSREKPAYAEVREAQSRSWAESPGDSMATRGAILKVVDADKPPLRIFFGKTPIEVATTDYQSRLATWTRLLPIRRAAGLLEARRCIPRILQVSLGLLAGARRLVTTPASAPRFASGPHWVHKLL